MDEFDDSYDLRMNWDPDERKITFVGPTHHEVFEIAVRVTDITTGHVYEVQGIQVQGTSSVGQTLH